MFLKDLFRKSVLKQKGQSLIEVVVATVIIALVLVALVSAITFSLSNVQFSRNKALATKYAQEAVEWLRRERDEGWYSFYGRASAGGSTYCVNDLNFDSSGPCTSYGYINDDYGIFRRQILLSQGTDRVTVTVLIYWPQGQRAEQVKVETFLTKWI